MDRVDYLQEYFLDLEEGWGTAYERYALNRFLDKLIKRLDIKSVLELPANGVMGVPGIKSLIFALHGCEVTLVHPDDAFLKEVKRLWDALELKAKFVKASYYKTPLPSSRWDLVWNFCVYEHFKNGREVIKEMSRLSKRYVLVETQNIFNIGLLFHRIYHLLAREVWDHGEIRRMSYKRVIEDMEMSGLKVIEVGGTDMPPWPDINMKIMPSTPVSRLRTSFERESRERKMQCSQDPAPGSELRPRVEVLPTSYIIERWTEKPKRLKTSFPMTLLKMWYIIEDYLPTMLKIYLSHHPYVLGEKV